MPAPDTSPDAGSAASEVTAGAAFWKNVALVNPDLDPDPAEGRRRFGDGKINVRAQGVERNPSLNSLVGAGDLWAPQPAGGDDLDALRPGLHRPLCGETHSAPVSDTPLKLISDISRNQIGVNICVANFLDIQASAFAGEFLQI